MNKKIVLLLTIFGFGLSYAQKTKFNLLIGTYTSKCESKGIYTYLFDTKTADLKLITNTEGVPNPSFLSISGDKKFVYAVNSDGENSAVTAFGLDAKTGALSFLNKEKTTGANNPCYIIDDKNNVITANYSSGNSSVFAKKTDGSLDKQKQLVQHFGQGPNKNRQEKAHLHSVQFSPDHAFVLATDLGSDKMFSYKYNPTASKVLTLFDSIVLKAGSGPRHFAFLKNSKFLYLLQELDGSLSTLKFTKGKFKLVGLTTVLADGFKSTFTAADIHISPDNKFLYATNRKEANDISCFKILKDGSLKFVARTSTLGDGPRNFAIDPSGNFVLVAHQYTNTVVVFKRDKTTGKLNDSGKKIELCAPVCLKFIE